MPNISEKWGYEIKFCLGGPFSKNEFIADHSLLPEKHESRLSRKSAMSQQAADFFRRRSESNVKHEDTSDQLKSGRSKSTYASMRNIGARTSSSRAANAPKKRADDTEELWGEAPWRYRSPKPPAQRKTLFGGILQLFSGRGSAGGSSPSQPESSQPVVGGRGGRTSHGSARGGTASSGTSSGHSRTSMAFTSRQTTANMSRQTTANMSRQTTASLGLSFSVSTRSFFSPFRGGPSEGPLNNATSTGVLLPVENNSVVPPAGEASRTSSSAQALNNPSPGTAPRETSTVEGPKTTKTSTVPPHDDMKNRSSNAGAAGPPPPDHDVEQPARTSSTADPRTSKQRPSRFPRFLSVGAALKNRFSGGALTPAGRNSSEGGRGGRRMSEESGRSRSSTAVGDAADAEEGLDEGPPISKSDSFVDAKRRLSSMEEFIRRRESALGGLASNKIAGLFEKINKRTELDHLEEEGDNFASELSEVPEKGAVHLPGNIGALSLRKERSSSAGRNDSDSSSSAFSSISDEEPIKTHMGKGMRTEAQLFQSRRLSLAEDVMDPSLSVPIVSTRLKGIGQRKTFLSARTTRARLPRSASIEEEGEEHDEVEQGKAGRRTPAGKMGAGVVERESGNTDVVLDEEQIILGTEKMVAASAATLERLEKAGAGADATTVPRRERGSKRGSVGSGRRGSSGAERTTGRRRSSSSGRRRSSTGKIKRDLTFDENWDRDEALEAEILRRGSAGGTGSIAEQVGGGARQDEQVCSWTLDFLVTILLGNIPPSNH